MGTFSSILIWLLLDIISFLLQLFFRSWEQLLLDAKMVIFQRNWFLTVLGFITMLCIMPFTIPYSLYFIYKQIKNTFF